MALRNMHSYVEFVSAKSIHPSFFSTRCRKKSGQSTNSLSFSNTTTYMYQKDLFLWPILFYFYACYVSACALKSFGLLRKSLPLCGLYEFPTHTCKGFRLFIAFLTELYFCHGKEYAR